MQQMPQQTAMQQAMPVGAPAQSNKGGLGALAAQRQQGGQADPRLMAMMQAFQNQDGGMRTQPAIHMGQPGGFGQAPTQAAMQMGTFGPNDMPSGTMPYDPRKPGGMMDVPVQLDPRRPMPMPLPPGLNRPMPMPLPPGLNRPMPMPVPKPAPQPARPTPKPVNPRFNQIMPFLR